MLQGSSATTTNNEKNSAASLIRLYCLFAAVDIISFLGSLWPGKAALRYDPTKTIPRPVRVEQKLQIQAVALPSYNIPTLSKPVLVLNTVGVRSCRSKQSQYTDTEQTSPSSQYSKGQKLQIQAVTIYRY